MQTAGSDFIHTCSISRVGAWRYVAVMQRGQAKGKMPGARAVSQLAGYPLWLNTLDDVDAKKIQ